MKEHKSCDKKNSYYANHSTILMLDSVYLERDCEVQWFLCIGMKGSIGCQDTLLIMNNSSSNYKNITHTHENTLILSICLVKEFKNLNEP